MPQPLNPDIIGQLLADHAFAEYLDWLSGEIDELDSVSGLDGMTNEAAGEEVRVRAKAVAKLHEILAPFIQYRTKREYTIEEVSKVKANYGL